MLVRAFESIDSWNAKTLNELLISALRAWAPSSLNDNDYSTYQILDKRNEKETDSIVLKLLFDNFGRWHINIDLFVLPKSFYSQFELDSPVFLKNTKHFNLKNINYSGFQKIVKYTFENKENVIRYPLERIGNVIHKLSNEEFTEFVDLYCKKQNKRFPKNKITYNDFVSQIKKIYFRENESACPMYLTHS